MKKGNRHLSNCFVFLKDKFLQFNIDKEGNSIIALLISMVDKIFQEFIFNKYSTQKDFFINYLIEYFLQDNFIEILLNYDIKNALEILSPFFDQRIYKRIN